MVKIVNDHNPVTTGRTIQPSLDSLQPRFFVVPLDASFMSKLKVTGIEGFV
jgi:hypothetical protein